MDATPRCKCDFLMTMVGSLCIIFPLGLSFFWGNLSIYTSSYMYIHGVSYSEIQTPWIMYGYMNCSGVFIPLGGLLVGIVGQKRTILIGIIFYNAGFFVSFYTLGASFAVFTVMFVVTFGIGSSILYINCMGYALERTKSSLGLAGGVLGSAINIGTAVINEFITLYINPGNKLPDLSLGPGRFFSQVDVVKRVPWMFIYLGMFSSGIQLFGFCFLRDNPPEYQMPQTVSHYHSSQETSHIISNISHNGTVVNRDCQDENITVNKKQHITKMMRSKVFYILWYTTSVSGLTFMVAYNYYKQVGQAQNMEDHLLTLIGTLASFMVIVMKLIFGVVMDKFGVKNAFIILFFQLSINGLFFSLTPYLHITVYFIVTILYLSSIGALYDSYPAFTMALLGNKYYALNYGLIWTSGIIINGFSPYVLGHILMKFGWHGLFQFVGVVCLIAGMVIIKWL